MITFGKTQPHWNYFLAIEKDLENISRYIEFADANMKTYSIELTHILLSASSEVDVIMKQLCLLIDPSKNADNINEYKAIIQNNVPSFATEDIYIHRFGLHFQPWINWSGNKNPLWWTSHNKVKHQRDLFFNEANLKNTINAVGALLITVTYYHKFLEYGSNPNNVFPYTTRQLQPEPMFLRLRDYYYNYVTIV